MEKLDYKDRLNDALRGTFQLLTGDRLEDYGDPDDNFGRIAEFWEIYLQHPITRKDVAVMMALLKIARLSGTGGTPDTFADLLGYSALANVLS